MVQLVRQDAQLPGAGFGGACEPVKDAWKLLGKEALVVIHSNPLIFQRGPSQGPAA